MRNIIRIVIASIAFFIPFQSSSARVIKLYPGNSSIVSCPDPPIRQAAIYQTAWGVQGSPYVSVEKYGEYAAEVKVSAYFSEKTYVRCDYYYYWYVNNYMRTGYASEFIEVQSYAVSISLSKSSLTMDIGDSYTLTAKMSPIINPTPTVRWGSTNSKVVSVSNGYIYANSSGTATVYAYTDAGPDKAECIVTVREDTPSRIEVTPSDVSLDIGDKKNLSVSVFPNSASKQVRWSSSNGNASVSQDGIVTGIAKGEALIVATSVKDNSVYGSCKATITNNIKSLSFSDEVVFMEVGKKTKLSVIVNPSTADTESISWESSNQDVAIVDANGNVQCLGIGHAKITAFLTNRPSIKSECTVACPRVIKFTNSEVLHISNLPYYHRSGDYLQFELDGPYGVEWYFDSRKVTSPLKLEQGAHIVKLKVISNGIYTDSIIRRIDVE